MRVYEEVLRKGITLIDEELGRMHQEIKDLKREREQLARLLNGGPAPPVPEEEINTPEILDARVKNLRKHIDADLPPELREVMYDPDDVIVEDEVCEDTSKDEAAEETFLFHQDIGKEPASNVQVRRVGPYPSLSSGNGIRDIYGDSAIDHFFPDEYGIKDKEMEI